MKQKGGFLLWQSIICRKTTINKVIKYLLVAKSDLTTFPFTEVCFGKIQLLKKCVKWTMFLSGYMRGGKTLKYLRFADFHFKTLQIISLGAWVHDYSSSTTPLQWVMTKSILNTISKVHILSKNPYFWLKVWVKMCIFWHEKPPKFPIFFKVYFLDKNWTFYTV